MSNNFEFGIRFTADGKIARAEIDRITQSTEAFTRATKGSLAGMEGGARIEKNLIAVRAAHIEKINQQASALQALKDHTANLVRNYQQTGSVSGEAFGKAAAGADKSAFATAGARRELIVLGHEAMTGNFSRMPGSFLVLAERMSMTAALFNPLTVGLAAAAAGTVGLAVAIHKGHEEMVAMDNALLVTSNYAGMTRGDMESLAAGMAKSGQITIGTSKDIVTALVASGRIGAESIGTVARLTSDYARATGQDIDKIAPEMIKLFSDPLKGAEELNKSMHFLTVADIEHIATLTRLGEVQAAQLFLAEKVAAHMPKEKENVGNLVVAYRELRGAITGAVDAAMNWGKTTPLEKQAADLKATIDRLEKGGNADGFAPNAANVAAMAALKENLALLQKQVGMQRELVDTQALEAKELDKQLAAQKLIEQSATYRIRALEDERKNTLENGKASVDKDRAVFEINKQIKNLRRSIGQESRQLTQAEIGYQEKLREITIKTGADEIESLYKLGAIDVVRRDAMLLFYSLKSNKSKQAAEEELLAVGKLTAAEKKQHEDKLRLLQAESAAIVAAANNKGLVEEKKFYDDIRKSVDALGSTEIAALDKSIAAQQRHNTEIGKTAEQIALARQEAENFGTTQLQVEADALRAAAATVVMAQQYKDIYTARANALDIEIAKRKEISGLMGDAAILEKNTAAAKASAAEWKKGWEETDRIAREAFLAWSDKGQSAAKVIGDALKKSLLSAIYEATIKPIAFQIYSSATGAMGMAGAAGNSLSGASGLYNAGASLAGLQAGYNTAAYSAFGGMGTEQAAMLAAQDSVFGLAGTASTLEAAGASAMGAFAAAVPYIAAAVVIANTIGLFGKGGGPQQGQYGTINAKGYAPEFTYSGGDSLGNQALTQSAYNQVASLYLAAGKQLTGLAINQGGKLDPNGTANALGYREISVGGRVVSGAAGWNNPAFSGAHDDAAGLANYLGKLTSAEIEQVAKAIDDPKLSAAIGKLKANFGDLAAAMPNYLTAQAAQQALLNSLKDDTERLSDAQKALSDAGIPDTVKGFKSMASGLDLTSQAGQDQLSTMLGLKGAFDLVQQSLVATGTAAVDTAAILLDRTAWQEKLDVLTGATTDRALAEQHDLAATTDAATQAIIRQVYAQQDLNAAAATAAQTLTAAVSGMARTAQDIAGIGGARGNLAGAMFDIRSRMAGFDAGAYWQGRVGSLSSSLGAAPTTATRLSVAGELQGAIASSYQAQVDAIAKARDARLSALQQEQAAYADSQRAAQGAAETLYRAMTGLGNFARSMLTGADSPLSPEARLAAAQGQYQGLLAKARGGNTEAAAGLQSAAGDYRSIARDFYGSNPAFAAIFNGVQSDLAARGATARPVDAAAYAASSFALQQQQADADSEFQTRLKELQTSALDKFTELDADMQTWQADLQTGLDEQALTLIHSGATLDQIASNTAALGEQIGGIVAAAIARTQGAQAETNAMLGRMLAASESTNRILSDKLAAVEARMAGVETEARLARD